MHTRALFLGPRTHSSQRFTREFQKLEPGVLFDFCHPPTSFQSFGIAFLDDDLHEEFGADYTENLISDIRVERPFAPIIAICTHLSVPRLRKLNAAGCDLVIAKDDPTDLQMAADFLRGHQSHSKQRGTLVGAILELLRDIGRLAECQREFATPQSRLRAEFRN